MPNEKKYQLTADNIDISDWLREKYKDFQRGIGINIQQRNKKDKGIKM